MNHLSTSQRALTSLSVIALATFALAFLALPQQTVHGQISCEELPPPLNEVEGFAEQVADSFWNKTDFCFFQEGVFDNLIQGNPRPDGIPPIDQPRFQSVEDASAWLEPQSPVISVYFNDIARAYPLEILIWHEIVNDEFGDVPVAVTFCPLCNSAITFDRRVDGETLRFGVSGFLINSDLVMWDDVTQSWWQQFTGEGIVGTHTDVLLDIIPSQVVGFGAFAGQFPDGEVLTRVTGFDRQYGTSTYTGYDTNASPFLFAGEPDTRNFPTSRVLAGVISGQPMAYPFDLLAEERVINDMIGEKDVVAFWQPGATSALDGQSINDSRDTGMAALFNRDLDGTLLTFSIDGDGVITDDQTGSTWNIFGVATDGELAGSQLTQEIANPHFWFAWAAFQPETLIYGAEG